ncbi:PriCT-2 domain-containing protein [Thiocapsa rosea]|uniref:DNA primase RepB-like protein n=1 Tax=Thiocapsa rosea TaxID=69360 RepID=A0A495VCB4_9GAMM|nr:PriCT-2 domain-containing protein [Thiocapsa rosea]RKT47051.1 DNA primase RepB-like protein [Thiocapsa rosea]
MSTIDTMKGETQQNEVAGEATRRKANVHSQLYHDQEGGTMSARSSTSLDTEHKESNFHDHDQQRDTHAEPNRNEAESFLTTLDEDAEAFTFQIFDDDKKRRDPAMASVLHGTLDEHWETLARSNLRGAGIFVTVNETDLKGRKKDNIIRVRTLWQEADHGDEPALPVEPHITVESSPGKYHRYILVDEAPLDEFDAVQQRLVDDYGSDPNAKDVSRVLRLPGFYHMKDRARPHLVKVVATSGAPPSAWSEIKRHLPPAERRTETNLGTLPAPGTPLLNPAEIASALAALSPDMPYGEWLKVGMALHSTGSGAEAFEIWDTWSEKGRDYRNGECRYRWDTFAQGGGVTLGTLFHMAREAGWQGEIGQHPDLRPLVKQQEQRMVEDFGKRYAVVMVMGQALVVYRELDENTGRMTTQFSRPGDIKLKHQPETLPVVTKKGESEHVEYKPLVDTWLKSPLRRTYDQLVFKPVAGLVAGKVALPDAKTLNLYQGLALVPQPGECQLILDHIREVWCSNNEVAYQYVMFWLARMFQKPQERGHTVIVLKSGEGTGKNIIIDILVRAFGNHATVAVKSEDLVGKFNDHLGTSVLVFANEAVWGGSKDQEGVLKSLITDEELPVERKYVPKYRVPSCVHLIMASNNDWVAPVGFDDRRFLILDASERRKDDMAYFKRLAEYIDNGGQEAFIDYLLKLDIGDFNPRVLPDMGLDQRTKRDAKVRGFESVTQWWLHCLQTGEILLTGVSPAVDGAWVAGSHNLPMDLARNWNNGQVLLPKQTLHDAYLQWCRQNSKRHSENLSSLIQKLKKLGDVGETRLSASVNPNRPRVLTIPALGACRAAFESATKMPWPWDGDEDETPADESLVQDLWPKAGPDWTRSMFSRQEQVRQGAEARVH